MRRLSFFIAASAVVAGMLLSGCKGQQPAEASSEKEVTGTSVAVTVAQQRDLSETVNVTGTLIPSNEVSVGPQFGGLISWVVGKIGTPVKQGQVVARIDDTDAMIQVRTAKAALHAAQARLEQAKAAAVQQRTSTDSGIVNAEAALAAAKARLQQAKTSRDALAATANAQIKQAEQALSAAKSRLAILQNGSRSQEKVIADNNVKLAKATLQNDKRNYDRLKHLFDQGAVAKASLDGAETKLQVSQAQYDSAVQQASLVSEGARQEDIDAAKATVEQAQAGLESARAGLKEVEVASDNVAIAETGVAQAKAALQSAKSSVHVDTMRDKDVLAAEAGVQQAKEALANAEQMLSYTMVKSPVNGVIAQKLAEVGQSVGNNEPIFVVTTDNALYFEAKVSELSASRLRAGQTVYLTVDAMQGDRANIYGKHHTSAIAGVVEKVVPVVDQRTRNFTVRVVVPANAGLYPGMFARGEVVVATYENVVAIPKDALVEKGDRQVVFIAENGVAREREVTLGATDGTLVQVLSGVRMGDEVITSGQQSLLDGDAVISAAEGAK